MSTEERTVLPEHNLDILRSVAVSAVFTQHLAASLGHREMSFVWLGHAGVLMFFVHTSLVLMASLERDGAPAHAGWVRRFYLRRALRIYPLAWAVIAIVVLLRVPAGTIPSTYSAPSPRGIVANLALVQNLAGQDDLLVPLWTLPIEVQMYLVLPLCFLVARTDRAKWLAAIVMAGLALASLYRWGGIPSYRIAGLWRLRVLDFVPSFLMGVLAYALLRRSPARTLAAWWWPIIVLGSIAVLVMWRVHWTVSIAFCAVLAIALAVVRGAAPSIWTRTARTIATYSYSIYLMHMLAIRMGFSVLRTYPVAMQWLGMAVTFVVAVMLGYHLIEKPGIALGRRLAS